MITKQDLKNFILLDKCINATKRQITYYEKSCPYAIHGKVSGSSSEYPYIRRSFTVAGGGYSAGGLTEEKRRQRIQDLHYKLRKQLKDYQDKRLEINEFIADIDDPDVKLLFTYVYIDGYSQEKTGELLGMEQSAVSKKLDRCIKAYISTVPV